jgi:outer membrane protein assembly factor BamA
LTLRIFSILTTLALLCPLCPLAAQSAFQLRILPVDGDSLALRKAIKTSWSFPDSSLLSAELKQIQSSLHNQAWLTASFDSLHWQDSSLTAWLHLGQQYHWISLSNGNVDEDLLSRAGFRPRLYQKKPVQQTEILKIQQRLLEQAENNGFPFAAVYLDSIRIQNGSVQAAIFLAKNKFIRFDSLTAKGDVNISNHYLRSYLGIRQGDPYSRRKVLKIKDRLLELPFLSEKNNATVSFRDDRADIQLSLERKKASKLDFLIGVLPDNSRPETQLLVTGTFNAELHNQFGLGERIFVAFERLRPQTQRLELAFSYPYLLDLPFGTDLKFNQYKRDSTYTDIIGEFGLKYLFEGGNFLKAFWNSTASNLIAVDTVAIKQGRRPAQLDVKNTGFGLEASWNHLDYRFNPRQGWSAWLKASAGARQIRRNQAILQVAENFYDTLPLRTFRLVLDARIERYLPLLERSAIKLSARSGALVSKEPVYRNEQYRIGGNALLRGFDEESIFATFFSVFTLEYRLLLAQNSWFYLFGDYGYSEDRRYGQPTAYGRWPALGAGMTFETTAGVFGLSIASGKQSNTPWELRNPKIHFGYVSIF